MKNKHPLKINKKSRCTFAKGHLYQELPRFDVSDLSYFHYWAGLGLPLLGLGCWEDTVAATTNINASDTSIRCSLTPQFYSVQDDSPWVERVTNP